LNSLTGNDLNVDKSLALFLSSKLRHKSKI